jgi:hypothetical protein
MKRLVAAVAIGGALAFSSSAPAAKPYTPLPAWALIQAGEPLVGAKVRAYKGRHVELKTRLRGPWDKAQTYKTGTAVFDAAKLPKTFVISVAGGTIRGAPFAGTLRATVTGYRSPQTVYVNPVTTLVSAYLRLHPKTTASAATARMKRFLAIPAWQDIGADLGSSAKYFSGAELMSEAAENGGFNAFVSLLAREAGRPGTKHPFRSNLPQDVPPSTTRWIVNGLAQGALSYVGGQTLGWVLGQFGIGDGVAGQLAQIQAQLAQISMQLTQLQNAVAEAAFGGLVAGADDYTSEITNAQKQLSTLANLDPNDPNFKATKTMLTNSLLAYIGGATSNHPCATGPAGVGLLEKQDILNGRLLQSPAGADGILVAGSRVMTGATRFWTSATTQQVQTLFDYYAGREAELLMMRVEFWHACSFSGSYVQDQIADEESQVNAQQALQKPSPDPTWAFGPPRLFVDTATGEMWFNYLSSGTYSWWDLDSQFFSIINEPDHSYGFSGWRLPSQDEFLRLVSGWSGSSPAAWLGSQTRFDSTGPSAVWTSTDASPFGEFVFDFQTAANDTTEPDLNNGHRVIPVRQIGPDESYWYPVNH